MPKPQYSKPASTLDLEARQKKDYVPDSQVGPAQEPGLSENGYIGTDPIYQNHANHTEAPYEVTEGAEAKVDERFLADEVDYDSTGPEEGSSTQDDVDTSDKQPSGGNPSSSGGASATPPSGGSTTPPAK